MTPKELNRRDLIRTSAVAAGAVAAGLSGNFVAAATDKEAIKKTRSYNADMEYRRLGATGMWVSAVCRSDSLLDWRSVRVVASWRCL